MNVLRRLQARLAQTGVKAVEPVPVPDLACPAGLEHFAWLLNHAPAPSPPPLRRSPTIETGDDIPLVLRVMQAYTAASKQYQPSSSGWDKEIFESKKEVHEALIGSDPETVAMLLRDPARTNLFWGFDSIAKAPDGSKEPYQLIIDRLNKSHDLDRLYALWLIDTLKSLAEAIGARRLAYPETQPADVGIHDAGRQTADQILAQIDAALGIDIRFPNPFPDEIGLAASRGVVGFRAIQALYQAWRIWTISRKAPGFRVMEIGAGLGRTAYFAHQLGIRDYTIIDIPLTNVAQGYFLGRVLGDEALTLAGEIDAGPLKILSPNFLKENPQHYDLIVNVDSWTEMSPDIASMYWDFARTYAKSVLSINHEHNPNTVLSLYVNDPGVYAIRYPYWMRRGYVEEYLTW